MFFARRRRHSLVELILVMLGIRCLCRRHRETDEATREEMRGKARQFRSKLKEAFAVWQEDETPAAEPEAPAEPQA
ncbi:MAG TPA: hypothetical protein VK464_17215 [Symbiobacteriaceae bacterium]|nr:hypothetical protein [Symbiobacteriaceae bacterium]